MGSSDRVSTISGLVLAAGIGVAVVAGTPVAAADDDAGNTASEGSEASKESTGDDEAAEPEDRADEEDDEDEGDEGVDDESEDELDPVEDDEALDGDEDTEGEDEGAAEDEVIVDESESQPVVDESEPIVDDTAQGGAEATAQRSFRFVETDTQTTESVPETQVEPAAVTTLPVLARLGLVTPLAGVLQSLTTQAPAPFRATVTPTVAFTPPPPPTPPRLVTGLLNLFGVGPSTGARPGAPVLPSLPQLLEFVFVAIRQHHQYVWHNTPPSVTPVLVSEDPVTGAKVYDFVLEDADDDRLVLKVGQPKYGNLTKNTDGTYAYTPDAEMAVAGYTDEFTVTVSDDTRLFGLPVFGGRHTDSEKVTVVVDPNKAPTLDVSIIEGPDEDTGETVYEVTVADPNNDAVTYTVFDDVDHGTLIHDPTTDTYTYTPSPTYAHAVAAGTEDGEDAFIVRATDEHGAYTDYLVNITVAPQNDVPVITITQVGAGEYTITVDDDDDDPTPVIAGPSHGTLTYNAGTGTYVYKPDYDYAHAILHGGPDTDAFTVTVDDGHGGTDTASQTITVSPENKAPTVELSAGPVDQTTGQVVLTVVGGDSDTEDGTPVYTWNVTGGSVVANPNGDGTYVFTPTDPHAAGAATIVVVATDVHGAATQSSVQVSIPYRQTDPTINVVKESVHGTTGAVTYNPNYFDAEGDTPIYTFTQPTHGSVEVVNGKIVYTPDYAYAHAQALNGNRTPFADQFTVTVTDGFGGTDTQIVDVEVTPLNQAPFFIVSSTVGSDQPIQHIVFLTVVDPDGDAMTLIDSVVVIPNGVVTVSSGGIQPLLNGNQVVVTLDASAGGAAAYTVMVRDGYGGQQVVSFSQQSPTPVTP